MTPYQYGALNPITNIDINGDSVWVTHRKGFLGLGGKETLRYESGKLYNKDGSAYGGKVNGFLKQTVNALGTINSAQEGATMLGELQRSTNHFTIVKGESQFSASDKPKAFADQLRTDPSLAVDLQLFNAVWTNLNGGSGGVISWNPSGAVLPTTSGGLTNSITDLAHEMFHGLDSNRGLLNSTVLNGVKRDEWQAVYRENVLRG